MTREDYYDLGAELYEPSNDYSPEQQAFDDAQPISEKPGGEFIF